MADRLISADALKMMRFVAPKHKEPEAEAYMTGWNDAIGAIIDNAPTIEPKHGRWINIKVSTTGKSSAECSECGAIVHTTFTSTVNYCPNCGAKMDERREDDNTD